MRRIGFANYRLEKKEIILRELKGKHRLIDIIMMRVKMVIYTNRNSSTDLYLKQVKMGMRDLFMITGQKLKLNCLHVLVFSTQSTVSTLTAMWSNPYSQF